MFGRSFKLLLHFDHYNFLVREYIQHILLTIKYRHLMRLEHRKNSFFPFFAIIKNILTLTHLWHILNDTTAADILKVMKAQKSMAGCLE